MYELLKADGRSLTDGRGNQVRRTGFIPGVIFGKGMESVLLKVQKQDLINSLTKGAHIMELELGGSEKHLVNVSHIQRDPKSHKILHISFHKLAEGQKTTVTVEIKLIGKPKGATEGGNLSQPLHEVAVTGLPGDIPEHIDVDVSELNLNDTLFVKDIPAISGLEFSAGDMDLPVAACAMPRAEKEPEPTAETAAEGDAATAEGAAAGEKKEGDGADAKDAKGAKGGDKK